jgi:hypothetical protein
MAGVGDATGQLESTGEERALEAPKGRRHVLKALGAAVAGALAGNLLSSKDALAHGSFHQDSNNADPAIHGNNTNGGAGVQGTSVSGVGTEGKSTTGIGVFGTSTDGRGVSGGSKYEAGVAGGSTYGAGVTGSSVEGTGVEGRGFFGVSGVGDESAGVGVFASSLNGRALVVAGTAQFLTAESGTIPAGQDSVFVFNRRVTGKSHITVTFIGSPGIPLAGFPIVILWVERQPGNGFVIHLTRKTGQETPFTYLIVETT